MEETTDSLRQTIDEVKKLGKLHLEDFKLLTIEKSIVMLSQGVIALLLLLIGLCAFFFISVGVVLLLAQVIPLVWCCFIMAGLYVALAIVILVCRKSLFVNPIAQFLSRLFLAPPSSDS